MFLLLFACTTGSSYPAQLASATCKSSYACIDNDIIEDFLDYKDINECISEIEAEYRQSDAYNDWENGSKDFNKENAELCLSEILDVQSDSDCDGDMDVFSFFFDIAAEECSEVYQ